MPVFGPWQVGNLSQSDYAKKAKKWAHGLKLVDPSIKLVSCGNTVSSQSFNLSLEVGLIGFCSGFDGLGS